MALRTLRTWSARQWLVMAVSAMVAAVILGLATGSIPNPVTDRILPVPWWGYLHWTASAVLAGLLAATYTTTKQSRGGERRATIGGVLSFFALGCPVCNKLVLLAVGASGALAWFAPLQPLLALLSLVLLAESLRRRLRGALVCPTANVMGLGRRS